MKSKKTLYIACCLFLGAALAIGACSSSGDKPGTGDGGEKPIKPTVTKYRNPVISMSLPDPTVIKADDGYFYLYTTEDIRNTPIYKSKDLVNWKFVGTAFNDDTRPKWNPKGGLWAPDINYINGKYVLYYAKSEWGGEWTCGIGVATADKPEGPFTDHGSILISQDINVQNSIDGFYFEDNGHKYMFWGSFHGIYGIELTDDGLHIKPGAEKVKIAGDQMEGTYIHKHDGYYYLFGSNGSCCEGAKSTYQVVYGRSKSLFGPYVTKKGEPMLNGSYDVLLHGTQYFAGPGHNSEFVTDDKGQDWVIYHSYLKGDPGKGRMIMLDQVQWKDEWPVIASQIPSYDHEIPYFNK